MENKMIQHLPKIDQEKMKILLQIEEEFETGKLTLDEARKQLKENVGQIKPYHIAYIEQNLMDNAPDDECLRVDMKMTLSLLRDVLDTSRPEDLPADHPIMCYYRENDEMRKVLLAVEDLVQYPLIKNQWLELYDRLKEYTKHFARKQNQLYSMLERKGFDKPSTTMWMFDDIVRDEIRDNRRLLEEDKDDEFIAAQQQLLDHARDLMNKEETILYPTSLALITPAEFEEMKSGDHEIGFAFIGHQMEKPVSPQLSASTSDTTELAADLQALLAKYGMNVGANAANTPLDVSNGKLTLEQINLIYKHLPIDISFVDENELVCFYSDTDHRIFPRSKNVIGREVTNCHPRKSVHIVKEIIEKFRNGEQDKADFWINKPDLFIYITYVAVRDAQGRFRGVLEMMQDCTAIRAMQGSQTLLTWSGREETAVKEEPEETPTTTMAIDEITPETRLKDLLATYPALKKRLPEIASEFKMLNTPLGKLMIPKVNVRMMSERSGLALETLIERLKAILSEEKP